MELNNLIEHHKELHKTFDKIEILNIKANYILRHSDLSWVEKYNLIFSKDLSNEVYKLIEFNYYDPDMDYEDDVIAFVKAFNDMLKEIKQIYLL